MIGKAHGDPLGNASLRRRTEPQYIQINQGDLPRQLRYADRRCGDHVLSSDDLCLRKSPGVDRLDDSHIRFRQC